MVEPILFPTWHPLPRPPWFPREPKLDRLLASNYDRGLDGFKLRLWRREARDLRKGLFGPKGSRKVPRFTRDLENYDGVMEFVLPNGWRLRLTYGPPPYDREAGKVGAEFIPPRAHRRLGRSQHAASLAA
jgi:hypothetical protein